MILILESMLETDSSPLNPNLFAEKLLRWVIKGFPELGDRAGMGLGALTHQVVSNKSFTAHPFEAAQAAWQKSGCQNAANGALMRTSVVGLWDFFSPDAVKENTTRMCHVTHADPRCLASCLLVTSLISALLRGEDRDAGIDLNDPAQMDTFIAKHVDATVAAVPALVERGHEAAFRAHVARPPNNDVAHLELGDPSGIGYTLKCMASGLYGFRSQESFEQTITRLAREGGDADTNGAVCGALHGVRLGYSRLPPAWLRALPNKAWLDQKLAKFVPRVLERAQQAKHAATAGAAAAAK
jgi:ADP-ribosylglycohydrolase